MPIVSAVSTPPLRTELLARGETANLIETSVVNSTLRTTPTAETAPQPRPRSADAGAEGQVLACWRSDHDLQRCAQHADQGERYRLVAWPTGRRSQLLSAPESWDWQASQPRQPWQHRSGGIVTASDCTGRVSHSCETSTTRSWSGRQALIWDRLHPDVQEQLYGQSPELSREATAALSSLRLQLPNGSPIDKAARRLVAAARWTTPKRSTLA